MCRRGVCDQQGEPTTVRAGGARSRNTDSTSMHRRRRDGGQVREAAVIFMCKENTVNAHKEQITARRIADDPHERHAWCAGIDSFDGRGARVAASQREQDA